MLRKRFEEARGDKDIRFHDLRHTAASFMVKGGASLVAVRDILGHSNLGVTSRYSHLALDDLQKAVDKMTNGTKMVQGLFCFFYANTRLFFSYIITAEIVVSSTHRTAIFKVFDVLI